MRKLIEMHQEYLIVCDNKACDYKVQNPTGDPNEESVMYLNKPCPKCGDNLFTEEDYMNKKKVLKRVNRINKWLSWITIFSPKRGKEKVVSVKCHNGIHVTDKTENITKKL